MKFTTLLYLCVLQVLAIDIEDGSNSRGARKLFGGYKITPRYCKPTRDKFIDSKGTNICMFNHECTQRNGQVVGACMDGFLFGACCQLPEGSAGELMDSDLNSASNPDNNLQTKPTTNYYIPTIKPTIGDITANGVSKITSSLLNGVLPTAQEDAVVQIEHDQFSTTGVTHPTAPDTILQNTYNEINPEDFKPNDKETTMRAEPTTPSYIQTSPYLNIIYSTNTPHYTSTTPYQRPIFKPKPYKPSTADTYVLVPTITHLTKPNKTQEIESIVNIIQMLNSSTKPPSTSYVFSATSTKRPQLYSDLITRKPPSTSYVFSSTLTTRRPEYTPQPTNISPSTYHYITTQKPSKPTKKRTTTVYTKIQTYSTSTKRPQYTSSTSYRPAHSTFANSPDAFIVTKKPPSTSYVYSTVLSKRPTTNTSPSYASSYPVTPPNTHTTYPSITPTVIVLSPATSEIAPLKSGINPQLSNPQRKPVTQVTINNHITHNIYSTSERPSPTVLITPKPSSTTNPIYPTDFDAISVEAETSSNDLNNFPPVRNPNLNMSIPLFDETEITTPVFIEDEILNTKIETFVNKIIQGLQEPFGGLKDYVFSNNSSPATNPTTKKPITKKGTTTKKPAKPSSGRPAQTKPTTKRPLTVVITKQPTTTKRTRPTKRITTTASNIEQETIATISQDYRTTCGVRPLVGNLRNSKIVGGKGAMFGEFPWQVLVRESTWLGLFTKNKCGGVLIGNRYVMTAAHCQPGFLASLVAVFGEFDISGDLESKRPLSRNIKRVIVHRKYDPATFENDLALLELEHPIQFDQHIVPICLPRESEEFVGRMATVTGWGRLKYGGGVPSVLQEVQVPIMENHVCQEMFRTAGHSKVILESFLCAGYANGQKDSCEGDSGGPLVLQRPDGRYQLAGTVSHGIKCAAPYLPGVYMRTSYYKPWIESVTGIH